MPAQPWSTHQRAILFAAYHDGIRGDRFAEAARAIGIKTRNANIRALAREFRHTPTARGDVSPAPKPHHASIPQAVPVTYYRTGVGSRHAVYRLTLTNPDDGSREVQLISITSRNRVRQHVLDGLAQSRANHRVRANNARPTTTERPGWIIDALEFIRVEEEVPWVRK